MLVDTFLTIDENERLIEWIKAHRRNLTHIFVTHGHGDHAYGVGQLLQAFPGADAIATAGTVTEARREAGDEYRDGFFRKLFPGQIPQPTVPAELSDYTIPLEDHELRVLDTGHTDTMATSVLWCPSLRLLVASDVVYNGTHMFLAETTTASRREWIATLTKLKELSRCTWSLATHDRTAPTTPPILTSRSATWRTSMTPRSRPARQPTCIRRSWNCIPGAPTPDRSGMPPRTPKPRSRY